jgi:hypothetical protein
MEEPKQIEETVVIDIIEETIKEVVEEPVVNTDPFNTNQFRKELLGMGKHRIISERFHRR